MSTTTNTSYKVHVQHTNQAEVDAVNIEDGAMLHTTDALYMGHNGQNVIVYPQGGVTSLGWARYDDTFYDGSDDDHKLILSDGVEVTFPNNGGTVYRSHSSIDFYDTSTNKIVGLNENDVYQMTVVFKKSSGNANQTHLDFKLTGADDYDRINMALGFYKGNDQTQNQHIMFQYYIDSNALANGLTPKITSEGGDSKIWDIIYFIQRTQNASLS
jgi:hypothetical protein